MKKFKLVYWSDCRGMEIDNVVVKEFESGRSVLNYLIEEKLESEDWIEYVNGMFNYKGEECNWVSNKSDWDMFVIGERGLEDSIFEVDFCNELNSCVVVREDSELFNREWDCDLVCELVNSLI
jgi:hypothetical protein